MTQALFGILASAVCLISCQNNDDSVANIRPKSMVTITQIKRSTMSQTVDLSATSQFLHHSIVTAPVTGYIHSVKISFNDRVNKGQLLYTLETKERKALGNWSTDDSLDKSYGLINVYAPMSGIITSIQKQQIGEFTTEDGILCGIADDNSLYFQINIPYEYIRYVKDNPVCTLVLPDGTETDIRIQKPLAQANTSLQTVPYLGTLEHMRHFIPENTIATAKLIIYQKSKAQVLPKSSVLSDELMQHFWVMDLINDSTAVKVPVTIGEQNDSLIEIKDPVFPENARILLSGNYGLADTALVKIF